MWTKRKAIDALALPDAGRRAVVETPAFAAQGPGEGLEMPEDSFNFVSSLEYALVPLASAAERAAVFAETAGRWWREGGAAPDLEALTQVEYFFVGTDNGQLLSVPLLPPHFYRTALPPAATADGGCGARRLLHRHAREEPVVAVAVTGALVASASADRHAALSLFHPRPAAVCALPHPAPLRSLRLWEGGSIGRPAEPSGGDGAWRAALAEAEAAAVYVITGDEAAVVRVWRVDVAAREAFVLHVLILTPRDTGMRSPLSPLAREDNARRAAARETAGAVHCLALDGDARLLGGADGGMYAWALDRLPWRPGDGPAAPSALAWDEEGGRPLPAGDDAAAVRVRAGRLMGRHVWLRSAAAARAATEAAAGLRWRDKWGGAVCGGRAVGLVSNGVELPAAGGAGELAALLAGGVVTVTFEEARTPLRVPLGVVEPAAQPLAFAPTAGVACFAVAVLAPGRRAVTCGSDGRARVWEWRPESSTYAPLLCAGAARPLRGLGRQLCVLRSPDVFLLSGYDEPLVREWHVYDAPRPAMRCERRFAPTPGEAAQPLAAAGELAEELAGALSAGGVACAAAFPPFGAAFVVGAFDHVIQTFSLGEVSGCAPPSNYVYNGLKTVRLPDDLPPEARSEGAEAVEEVGAPAP